MVEAMLQERWQRKVEEMQASSDQAVTPSLGFLLQASFYMGENHSSDISKSLLLGPVPWPRG